MKKIMSTSFGVLFIASLASLVADAHVFFPNHEQLVAGSGIATGLLLSFIGLIMFLKGK